MPKLQKLRKALAARVAAPLIAALAKTGVTPNMVTVAGFLVVIAAAVLVYLGYPLAAGLVMLFSGCFDFVDGALARATNRVSKFGGILDSSLDRISEGAMLLGVIGFFIYRTAAFQPWIIILTAYALLASFMVSYVRSRAEAAGLECQVGISTRPERVIVLGLGLLLCPLNNYFLVGAVGLISLFSTITVIHRLVHVRKG
jgi:CDP-diacylglycerol--glycerol-3-phosphate 3-phosphatidyltransferase